MKTVLLLAVIQAQLVAFAMSKGTAVPGDVKYVELAFSSSRSSSPALLKKWKQVS